MNAAAQRYNERAIELEEQESVQEAEHMYRRAIATAPSGAIPWYNLGLLYKRQHRWQDSLTCNIRAVELDPADTDAWWNLGIAATAVGDWQAARRAWRAHGLEVPSGEGPLDLGLGLIPIRINPRDSGEVVWCWRLDPARAIVRSVPLPESRHRYGDLLLHDGAPNGYRLFHGRELPVFDALEVIERSPYSTYELTIGGADDQDIEALLDAAAQAELGAEDWSSIRTLCKLCSEGRPHKQHQPVAITSTDRRRLGIAALSMSAVESVLAAWRSGMPTGAVESVRCVLDAAAAADRPERDEGGATR